MRSDFSAIHRVDEVEQLPGPRFFALAYRINAYPGVIQAAWRAQLARKSAGRPTGPTEMTGKQWLAGKPGVADQISRVPLRRR